MKNVVCTMMEGNYHFGLAALVNSMIRNGYMEDIYVGYRGTLPEWALAGIRSSETIWHDGKVSVLSLSSGGQLMFFPLATKIHFTNYKPDFMLSLLSGPANACDSISYVDPDICLNTSWRFIEEWISCGVAVCEDVNSPLPENNPRRVGWRRFYECHGLSLKYRRSEYVNGGFVGLMVKDQAFLRLWSKVTNLMSEEIGSLEIGLAQDAQYKSVGFANCFNRTDQDALNAALEAWEGSVSVLGKDAMGFQHGMAVWLHAIGNNKPWNRNYLLDAVKGVSPRRIDKVFWNNANFVLRPHEDSFVRSQKVRIAVASAISRFYRKA